MSTVDSNIPLNTLKSSAHKNLGGLLTKEFLYEQHYTFNKSAATIANECGCSDVTVCYYMKKHGIKSRGMEIRKGIKLTFSQEYKKTHGQSRTRMYRIWNGMMKRCTNPKTQYFKLYGGRGISVCERWYQFANFYNDMKLGYNSNLTLERIDSNGNYEPSNCKWVTQKSQQQNRRDNVRLTINGCVGTIREWSDISGTNFDTIWTRYHHRWTHEECVYGRKKENLN